MVRALVFAAVAFGTFALAAHSTYAACGGWYPFYGYRQPNYLAQPYIVYAQPSTAQAYTSYYAPPAQGAAAPAAVVAPQYKYYYAPPCATSGGWHPFYGYRQPNLN
jgi:hypothetical protein